MTAHLLVGGIVLFVAFLLFNGRGGMDSARFRKRYPLSADLHQRAEARRRALEREGL